MEPRAQAALARLLAKTAERPGAGVLEDVLRVLGRKGLAQTGEDPRTLRLNLQTETLGLFTQGQGPVCV
jgi:hypothetical protein